MPKQTKSYRISDLTRHQLEQLSKNWGTSLTETLTLIIDRAYIQERNRIAMDAQNLTDEEIKEQIRQLEIEDGDEDIEHPDTQFSDYDETTE